MMSPSRAQIEMRNHTKMGFVFVLISVRKFRHVGFQCCQFGLLCQIKTIDV